MITCSRCGEKKEAITKTAFYTGDVGVQLKAHACVDCWQDWLKMQIMIVNEYRLDMMDPKTDEFLNLQVLAFFNLNNDGKQTAKVEYIPPKNS